MAQAEDIEAIDRILDGKVSPEQEKAFYQRLDQDQALKALYEQQKFIRNGLEGLGIEQTENLLKKSSVSPQTTKKNRAWLKWAAILIPFIGLTLLWLLPPANQNIADLFYELPSANLERSANDESTYREAMSFFSNADYHHAVEALESIDPGSGTYENSRYYLAHAYYQLGRFEQARNSFINLIPAQNQDIAQQASWFAALSGLKAGISQDQIKEELHSIRDDPNQFYRGRAEDVLEKLD